MAIARWNPWQTYTKHEGWIRRRLGRTRKLFAFLRAYRHELFDNAFHAELETMYRDTGAGKPPVPPALLAIVTLLQAYLQVSDAEAVELSVMDRRWQLVLDGLEAAEPPFSQRALGEFRTRLMRTEMDRRLLERIGALPIRRYWRSCAGWDGIPAFALRPRSVSSVPASRPAKWKSSLWFQDGRCSYTTWRLPRSSSDQLRWP